MDVRNNGGRLHTFAWSRFPQILLMSFGIAFVSLLIGSVLRVVLHVDV